MLQTWWQQFGKGPFLIRLDYAPIPQARSIQKHVWPTQIRDLTMTRVYRYSNQSLALKEDPGFATSLWRKHLKRTRRGVKSQPSQGHTGHPSTCCDSNPGKNMDTDCFSSGCPPDSSLQPPPCSSEPGGSAVNHCKTPPPHPRQKVDLIV